MQQIYLSVNADESLALRGYLLSILLRAGMNVIDPPEASPEELRAAINAADCSVHILSRDYGKTLESDPATSLARFQFNEARKKLERDPENFRIFIWYPPEVLSAGKEPLQEEFINEIRNSISQNMVFTNISSPIQLVDDIRSMLVTEQKTKFDIKSTEVFLVFNELDEGEADGIVDMLSDIVDVEKLNIVQDSDMDYSEFCSQQIGKSKLAVVYFKETADWALPFAQQIWKKVGGASSHTPILLIGDEDPEINLNKKFIAPKVISLIVAGELIPLEIKVNYDKAIEGKT
ncbi:MAG: hypothetical protein ACJ76F_10915 [Bacteroidia bacterium]